MGVYDSAGKLVRVLHRDAPTTDFVSALNGLITFWDGKDDSGKLLPAGKYRAKGYMMADMDFEGVAFLGNDFVDKDGKRKSTAQDHGHGRRGICHVTGSGAG